ncbi:MAG: HAMP domain-containing histidine kinase [Clostridiales bacterium]|nr:HAMP domain-containing histidine kinase [Clostridiales bacterium]
MKKSKRSSLAYRDAYFVGRLGIQGKVQIYLAVLISFVISLIWICQIALLFGFYQSYRSGQVRSAANMIVKNIDHDDLEELADRISAENELCMLLVDAEGTEIISIDHVRFCLLHHMSRRDLSRLIERTPPDGTELVEMQSVAPFRNDKYHAEHFEGNVPGENSGKGRSMICSRRVFFRDGTTGTLMINAQITPTGTILSMLRRQFLYILVLVLLATFIIGYLMATSVSQPIIETNRAAKALSRGEYQRPPHSGGYREIAELNDTLVQAADDLRKVETLQRELIANISHDLRTPLTMIQGYAETMRDLPDEMNPENMQVIIDETHRLSSLVNEVLDFSRLRTGTMQMDFSVFDLTETVRTICQRVSAMTEKDGYQVVCQADRPCRVKGDSARIEQVVYNLLGNALTYTGEDRRVILKEEDRESRVRVSISDSGSGIDPEELPYIWDRYYRTRESHKRAVIGSGLGLNICRGILEKHHTPYGVDSTPGAGTTFWFEMEKAE